jgi:hypothetical protein
MRQILWFGDNPAAVDASIGASYVDKTWTDVNTTMCKEMSIAVKMKMSDLDGSQKSRPVDVPISDIFKGRLHVVALRPPQIQPSRSCRDPLRRLFSERKGAISVVRISCRNSTTDWPCSEWASGAPEKKMVLVETVGCVVR